MSIIDRYVIRQVLVPFVLGLVVFTFIFIIPEMMEYAETLVAKGVPAAVITSLLVKLIPFALSLTIPMSLLLALLVAFGRLSADREFVAMQACGVSLLRLLRPVGLFAIGGWMATTYVLIWGVPAANQSFREEVFEISKQRAEGEVKPRVFFDQFRDFVVYVRDVPPAGNVWNGIFIADMRPDRGSGVYLARTGRVAVNVEQRLIDIVLEDGVRHSLDASGHYDVLEFDTYRVTVDPTSAFLGGDLPKGLTEMSVFELQVQIAENEGRIDPVTHRPVSTHNERMAIHQKFSIPVACLVFGLIGLALGATNRRDGLLGNFVLGLIVIFAYYIPLDLGPRMVRGGLIPVWLGKWLPNFVLGAIGIMLFIWRDRVADTPITLRLPSFLRRQPATARASMLRFTGASILDRYVTATYVRFLLLAAASLVGIFYISTLIELSDKVFKGTATWAQVAQYFWYATPQWMYYVLPLSVLLASLVTIAILTKNSELIVMKACGISLYRVALPILASALIVGGLLFVMEETILGASNRQAESFRHVIRGGTPETFDVVQQRWLVGSRGEIYHYQWFDPRNRLLNQLKIFEFSNGMERLTRRTYAELASYVQGDAEGEGDLWRIERGWTREFDGKEVTDLELITTAERRIESPAYFGTETPRPEFMGYTELRQHLNVLRASGFDVVAEEVAVARKLAFPFVTLVMTLIAVPFAVTIGRSGAMGGIGVGIALAITYWTVISVFAALGTGGVLTPLLAAWAPNLLFGAGAVYLLLTVRT
jgi:LPS export ABC transporter permease LptF/LPS export ABC transporter permease LptG